MRARDNAPEWPTHRAKARKRRRERARLARAAQLSAARAFTPWWAYAWQRAIARDLGGREQGAPRDGAGGD